MVSFFDHLNRILADGAATTALVPGDCKRDME